MYWGIPNSYAFPPNGNKTSFLRKVGPYKYYIWCSPAEEQFQEKKKETDEKARGIGKQQWEETVISE